MRDTHNTVKKTGIKKKNRLIQLKSILNSKIKSCIQNREIPSLCQDLVLKLWPNTLFHILKTHGGNSPQCNNAFNMYNELLLSIQKIRTETDFQKLKTMHMNIVRSNNSMLMLYHTENKVESAIKSLLNHYNNELSDSVFNKPIKPKDTAIINEILPNNIKPGIWCEIYTDEITPPRRLRLSLINLDTNTLIFVNRKGLKKLERDIQEFCREIKNGVSKIYEHDSLFTKPNTKSQFKKIG